jgi:hypothetical protein
MYSKDTKPEYNVCTSLQTTQQLQSFRKIHRILRNYSKRRRETLLRGIMSHSKGHKDNSTLKKAKIYGVGRIRVHRGNLINIFMISPTCNMV